MTWTRIKRWIGRRSVLILAAVNGGCGFLFLWGVTTSMAEVAISSPAERALFQLLRVAFLASPVLAVAITCFVGCLRGRAGLPILAVRNKAALLIWASYGVAIAVLGILAGG